MRKIKTNGQTALSFLLLVIGIVSLFWQFILNKLFLFPGNFLLAWFEPYKTDNFSGSFISLAHKPIAEDTFKLIYPFKVFAIDLIKHLQLPLWNPYNGSGMPFLAAINSGYLDPFNLLYFALPNHFAWTLIIVIETILIGVFTFLYAKSIKLGNQASFLTAIVFTLSGAVITRISFSIFTLGIALLPFSLYALEMYRQKGQAKYLLFLSLAVGILLLSTHLQYSFYILAFIVFYGIVRFNYKNTTDRIKKLLLSFLSIILGLGLASIQLIPTIELFKYANLNPESSTFIFNTALLSLKNLITILIPNYYGNPSTYNYFGTGDYIETAIYLGLIPCLFVFFSILSLKEGKTSSLVKFYLLVTFLTILVSLKLPFIAFLYGLNIPFLSVGVPTRIFFITSFSLAILCGFGYQYLVSMQDLGKKVLIPLLVFSFFVILIFAVTVLSINSSCPELMKNCRITSLRNTLIEVGGFIASFVLIVAYSAFNLKKKKLSSIIPVIVILIVYLLGFYNSFKFLPFSPKETFFPESGVISALKMVSKNTRVLGIGEANIIPNFATYFKFYDPQYVNPLYIRRYGELVSFANTGSFPPPLLRSDVNIITDATPSADMEFRRERIMSLLNIDHLLYKKSQVLPDYKKDLVSWENDKWYIVKRKNSLPRAYLVGKLSIVSDSQRKLQALFNPSFNPATAAIVEQGSKELSLVKEARTQGSAIVKSYEENKVLIETRSLTNSLLVLSDNYYPGWKAFVDDKEVFIYRTNYTLRGIVVPSGTHIVSFRYDPLSFKIGLFLSGLSLFIFLAISLTVLTRIKIPFNITRDIKNVKSVL
ncbi:MAG: YfhO family protein [Candidatus Levybacteria bacterium]|nr:YfhO family protein [Candidatus Levybacteria bacterium]